MSATLDISESNGAGESVTHAIHNFVLGDTDEPNMFPSSDHDVAHGANSYEKWIRLYVSNLPDGEKLSNLRVWVTGNLRSGDVLKTNVRTSGYSAASYATPVTTTSTVATQDMPTSEPDSANLGISGSLSTVLTGTDPWTPVYSDYLVVQLQTSAVGAGATIRDLVLHLAYDAAPA